MEVMGAIPQANYVGARRADVGGLGIEGRQSHSDGRTLSEIAMRTPYTPTVHGARVCERGTTRAAN